MVEFSESGRIVFSEFPVSTFLEEFNPKATPTTSIIKSSDSEKIAFWGIDNLFPQRIKDIIRKDTVLSNGLLWKTNALVGGGIVYGKIKYDENGNKILVPEKNKEIEQFFFNTNINRYTREAAFEYYSFWNAFPELILDTGRNKIISITTNESMWCRFAKDGGAKKNMYINANWKDGAKIEDKETTTVPVLDPYFLPLTQLKEGKSSKYIYPIAGMDSGQGYYAVPPWYSAVESGWVEYSADIPKYKKSLMKNQMSIKYHVQIPTDYWSNIEPNWTKKTEEERKKIKQEEFSLFEKVFSGADNAGKAIYTEYVSDKHSGKEFSQWKITPIGEALKDGMYIADSLEASLHKYTAAGIDATLVNTPSKGGLAAGSGSDKRVAFNIYMATVKPDQDLILEPLNLIKYFNGWDEDIVFWFENYYLSTLNEVSPQKRGL